jgi:hypothetical protein
MPSEHSPQGNAGEYRNEADKMLSTKMEPTVVSLIRGIREEERARVWWNEVNRHGYGEGDGVFEAMRERLESV